MTAFLLRRGIALVIVLVFQTLIIFSLQQLVPSDPARLVAGPTAPQAVVDQKRAELGLDDPVLIQYARFLRRLIYGDLGRSISTNRPVRDDLATFLPASLELMAAALILGAICGGAIGILQTISARVALPFRLLLVGLASVPIFLLGILFLLLFWFELGWLPSGDRTSMPLPVHLPTGFFLADSVILGRPSLAIDAMRHLALPALTLAVPVAVAVARTLQSSLFTVMRQGHIKTAYAKGLSNAAVVWRHGLRNAAQAPLTVLSLQLGLMYANILIVERIYAWPGVGLYLVQAFANSDWPAIVGGAFAFGLLYVLTNLVIEILQKLADPRLRL